MKTYRNYFVLLVGVVVGIALLAGSACGQVWEEWVARYGEPNLNDAQANSFARDAEGNLYIAGDTWTQGGSAPIGFLLIKYNLVGEFQWRTVYYDSSDISDDLIAMALDATGNIFLTGYSHMGSSTAGDIVTTKFDANGTLIWVARYDGPIHEFDMPGGLATDSQGNVYVTGGSDQDAGPGLDPTCVTLKYSNDGQLLWTATYFSSAGIGSSGGGHAIAIAANGSVYVAGSFAVSGSYSDFLTIKYNSSGAQQWAANYNGPGNWHDFAYWVAAGISGNIYVVGMSPPSFGGALDYDWVTIKYNADGAAQWIQRLDGTAHQDDWAHALVLDAHENVYIAGYLVNVGTGGGDIAAVKYDSSGNEHWLAQYNGLGSGPDYASGLALDQDQNVYVAGRSDLQYGPGENGALTTIKYDSDGLAEWVEIYNSTTSNEGAFSVVLDSSGSAFVAGNSNYSWIPDTVTIVKYTQTRPINISITPVSPPIQIPPSGGSFDFTVEITNGAQSPQTFDAWISVQLPGGSWYGPVLGPIELILPGQGNLTRLRTQNVPGNAPAGTYTYRGYVGDYPAKWDSSSFTFEKLGSGGLGLGAGDWSNTGQSLDEWFGVTQAVIPDAFALEQNFPNPFNPTTALSYKLQAASHVKLEVFDLSGRSVAVLVDGMKDAGAYQVTWDASDMPSGLYFCRIQAGNFRDVVKMMLVK